MSRSRIYLSPNFAYLFTNRRLKMKVVVMKKDSFAVAEFLNVSNIAYSEVSDTKSVTITYGSAQTATYNLADYLISILW